ncbi:hypothetical protein JCM8097_006168 [Rhodosporidiobolus ruineniae]
MVADHVHCRAHTHHEEPPCWTASPLRDFRTWNKLRYEPWLRRVYAEDVKPFWDQPADTFLMYPTETAADLRQSSIDLLIQALVDMSAIFSNEKQVERLHAKWDGASTSQREDWCLKLWRKEQERAEEDHHTLSRPEAPEFTLAWAADPDNLYRLANSLPFDRYRYLYRHISHPAWDRLNCWPSSARMPPSRAVRSFSETGKIIRTGYLAEFCLSLLRLVLDLPNTSPGLGQPQRPSVQLCEGDELLFHHAGSMALHEAQQDAAEHSVAVCAYCRMPGCPNCKAGRLNVCERCKKVGRQVWYCDAECMKRDWARHRLGCGRTLLEYEATVSAASSATAPNDLQRENQKWLDARPRAVWGLPLSAKEQDMIGAIELDPERVTSPLSEQPLLEFTLPTFVRPFATSLEAFHNLRTAVVEQKHMVHIATLAYFIQLKCALVGPSWSAVSDSFLDLLAGLLEVDADEVKREANVVRKRLERGKALVVADETVIAALRQMKEAKPDLTLPYQNIPLTALPMLDRLLSGKSYYSFPTWPGPSHDLAADLSALSLSPTPVRVTLPPVPYTTVHIDPDTPPAVRASKALRKLALRVLTTAGRDERAVGLLVLAVQTHMKVDADALAAAAARGDAGSVEALTEVRRYLAEMLGAHLGMAKDVVEQAVEKARKELAEPEDALPDEVRAELDSVREVLAFLKTAELTGSEDEAETAAPSRRKGKKKKKKAKGKKKLAGAEVEE